MIQLTEEQAEAVMNDEPVVLSLPEVAEEVLILRAKHLASIREMLADQAEQDAFAAFAWEQAKSLAAENPY